MRQCRGLTKIVMDALKSYSTSQLAEGGILALSAHVPADRLFAQ